jgi:hypothetical protein
VGDLPFLLDERTERIEELRRLMTCSDVTSAEKYRPVTRRRERHGQFS